MRQVLRDESGQVSVEYTLLLIAFGIPLLAVSIVLLNTLSEHYRMISFLQTLPFP